MNYLLILTHNRFLKPFFSERVKEALSSDILYIYCYFLGKNNDKSEVQYPPSGRRDDYCTSRVAKSLY